MSGGLSRFVGARAPAQDGPLDVLGRFARLDQPAAIPGESCEMCGTPLGDRDLDHAHVVNLESRELLCTCRACYLLFTHEGAAGGKYRAVPDRYLRDPGFRMTDAQWDDIQIPVAMAFLFFNSTLDRFVAFYPSPGGATESLLDLGAWSDVLAANPTFAEPEPDVEALLLRRSEAGFECFLVPIDACYELVGRFRMHWKGFDGGEEAAEEIETFFSGLRERSREVGRGVDE